jgi:hypothetical protein
VNIFLFSITGGLSENIQVAMQASFPGARHANIPVALHFKSALQLRDHEIRAGGARQVFFGELAGAEQPTGEAGLLFWRRGSILHYKYPFSGD